MSSMPIVKAGIEPEPSAARECERARDTAPELLEALESLADGVLLMDRDWRLTYANEQARRISRLEPWDLNAKTHWELYPETVGSEAERVYRRVMQERVAEAFEFFYAPFGVWYKLRVVPSMNGICLQYSDVTELRRAEEARKQTAAELNEVFETTTDGVVSLDREWRFTFLNRRAREILAGAGELIGETLWNRFPETVFEGSPFVENYYKTMVDGERRVFESFYPAPFDSWFRLESLPTSYGMILFFRDVTQARRDEEALRESEGRYRVLTELNPQALWTGAPDGRITYANQRFLEYIGHDFVPEDGTEWLRGFYEEDRQRVQETWSHSVRTGEEYSIDARLTRSADGAHRWWHLRALPLRDESGAITLWLGVATDVHDQRNAAEALTKERAEVVRKSAELEAVYDTAPVGLALFEPKEFRYLRVNARQAEIIGLPAEQIIGRRFQEVARTEVVPELFGKVIRGETVRDASFSTDFHNRPGDMRQFNVNYSPVFGGNGEVRAISCAVLEITQLRKAEAALVQSEKLAAVGRLASSISHEINNPLEAVTNLLYLAATEQGLSEEGRSYVRMAQDEVARVSQIATQTLRFHRQANSPTAVTAAQLVDPVLNLYQGRLTNSGVQVEAGYGTSRKVLCFENDIRQVLNNLIANAIDAMRTGGRLLIRAHNAFDLRSDSEGVRISVADTGHGMSGETLKRIFDPFYTTKGLNGNGLGLWISQGIVERHQGQLRVRSSEGGAVRGTVFSLFLPSSHEPAAS